MALGIIEKSILTDIANAIRHQAGHARGLLPADMAEAVAALDGRLEGEAEQRAAEAGSGVLNNAVFADLASAIRAQNGLTKLYTPPEMAGAILSLTWIVEPTLLAILTDAGTLEFAFRDRVESVYGSVSLWWQVDATGYAKAAERPWDEAIGLVRRCVIDASVGSAGVTSASWWLHGCSNLTQAEGLEALSGVATMDGMFTNCGALESVFSTRELAPASAKQIFYGCPRLVGAKGYVPGSSDGPASLSFGDAGVLTDPGADTRAWFACRLFADGELVLGEGSGTGNPTLEGRMCAQARYASGTAAPWAKRASSVKRVRIAPSMGELPYVNMNYWFYGCTALGALEGAARLPAVREMRHTFNRCTSLTTLDLRGVSPSEITSVFSTFSSCSSLVSITVDATWQLPAGVADMGCFSGCKSLVGGAGTAWTSSKTSGLYMRIDREDAPGYLTAG